jgi:large subunit ribosomal protein L6
MSRIGKKFIAIPKGVKIDVQPDAVEVQGPKGKLRQVLPAGIGFEVDGDQLHARTMRDDPELGKFHGLARSLVANAVRGVTEGFRKDLDIVGVGYRAEVKGKQVVFALGYSHPVVFEIRSTSRRTSPSPASTASPSARSRRTSAGSGSPIRTSRRASATRAKC